MSTADYWEKTEIKQKNLERGNLNGKVPYYCEELRLNIWDKSIEKAKEFAERLKVRNLNQKRGGNQKAK